jgi:hypothetical protein
VAGGPELLVFPDEVVGRAFYPVEDGIYYMGQGGRRGEWALKFYDQATGRSQVLTTVVGSLGLGLTVSSDRSTVLFTLAERTGADLMLIENFR